MLMGLLRRLRSAFDWPTNEWFIVAINLECQGGACGKFVEHRFQKARDSTVIPCIAKSLKTRQTELTTPNFLEPLRQLAVPSLHLVARGRASYRRAAGAAKPVPGAPM